MTVLPKSWRAATCLVLTAGVWLAAGSAWAAEPVLWTDAVGVDGIEGDGCSLCTTLRKIAPTGWGNAGAASWQLIREEGYVEFLVSSGATAMVGLSHGNTDASYGDVDYGLLITNGQLKVYESGVWKGDFGSYESSDQLRIAVSGGVVTYSRNGIVFYTSMRTPAFPLLVDTALYSQGAKLVAVYIGSTSDLRLRPVTWTSPAGVAVSGNSLRKTAPTAWGNAGAISTQTISGDGYVEFTASETTSYRMLGLSNGNTNSSWDDIDFAVYLYGGQVQIYEAGTLIGNFGSYATGDEFRIEVSGSSVRYLHDGTELYRSFRDPVRPLLVDTALYTQDATLSSAWVSGSTPPPPLIEAVAWTELVGVSASLNNLRKTAPTAWGNAGAVSRQVIGYDGYVEFTASETTTHRMLGLSHGNTNSSWDDIDFALYLGEGQIKIYEAGVFKGALGAYATGDRLRVSVSCGDSVTYWRNGTLLYTSYLPSSIAVCNLLVDTALYTQNATLGPVGISGAWTPLLTNPLSVTKTGTGAGTVTSTPAGIDCGATCSAVLPSSASVTLAANASPGSGFLGWSGGYCSGAGSCVVTMETAKEVAAEFGLLPSLSVNDVSVVEGDAGSSDAILTVTLSAVMDHTVTVGYSTADGTATSGSDYTATSGTLTFPAGTTVLTVAVPVTGDTTFEAPETVLVNLSGALGAWVADAQGQITITNDDTATTEPVAWRALVGVTASGYSLTKTATTAWGNAGAISAQRIVFGDGYVEFTASETTTARMLGLSNGNTNSSWDDIDFSLYLYGAQIQVYEASALKGSFGTYATGDTLRVAVTAGVVTYSRNGTVFYTSARTPVYPLLVDTALYNQNATLDSVMILGATSTPTTDDVVWTSRVGVTATGNSLAKTAATGWGNAGAISTQSIASGDGYVEFTASETTTARMLGLSNGNSSSSWDDIDFSLYLYGSQIQVYEAGVLKGSFGTYATGDILRVAVSGGVVSYSRNGTAFYTSTKVPAYPLLVDCALYSQGATLRAVVIATQPVPVRELTVTKLGTTTGRITSMPGGIDCGDSCVARFADRTLVTLTAAANGGPPFAAWSGGGCSGTEACVVTMDASKSVTATFGLPIPQSERDALIALYNSTTGPGWTFKDGWLGAPGTECSWYGVSCDGATSTVMYLNLEANNLDGTLPPELGDLTHLVYLYLYSNQLRGAIPSELGKLAALQRLWLQGNQLSGTIPTRLGELANLQLLLLSDNQLSGTIPAELGDLVNLWWLDLHANQLSGAIPPRLGNLTALFSLWLFENQLSGAIPAELGNLTNLQDLLLHSNQLSGPIPQELGNLKNLLQLWLQSNQLSAPIPQELGTLPQLHYLNLSSNQLSGAIPTSLGALTRLGYLHLEENRLSGTIPAELGNLGQLQDLTLNSNQLGGLIPVSLTNLTQVYLLDVGYNALYAEDSGLTAFLDARDPDWQTTQTVAATGVAVDALTPTSVTLGWTPIPYAADAGGYRVWVATTSGGPYALATTTADKAAASATIDGLTLGTAYFFVVDTVTNPHPNNQNTVVSERTDEVTGAPAITHELALTTVGTSRIAYEVAYDPGISLPAPPAEGSRAAAILARRSLRGSSFQLGD